MAEHFLNLRVRPPRIVVLINKDAAQNDLLLCFDFLSKLWGGRFCQIISVKSLECDSLTAFRLASLRPDFVYGVGLDDKLWNDAVAAACQPRFYRPLSEVYDGGFKQ